MTALGALCSVPGAPLAALVAAGEPGWVGLAVLGLLGGLLLLDDTSLAQTWFSQPLPVAVLTGVLCGDPVTGLAVGLPVQLILAGNLPVGQSFIGDSVPVMVAAVGGATLAGHGLQPAPGAPMSGLPLIGWLVLAVGLFSSVGHFLVMAERRAHTLWMLEGHRTLRDGRLGRVDGIQIRCLLLTLLRGALTTVLLLVVMERVWLPLYDSLPPAWLAPLAILPVLLPGLGIGNLIGHYGLRGSWRWVGSGLVVSFCLTRYVL